MKKFLALCVGLALLGGQAAPSLGFQEYPSLEIAPYVGYIQYDGDIPHYVSNLVYGFRADLRTIPKIGFQFHYASSASTGSFPSQPFGLDEYVQRIQLNVTRDFYLTSGWLFGGFGGIGRFVRQQGDLYDTDFSLQAGFLGRRNLWGPLYMRADVGWTGAFLKDHDPESAFGDRSLTHNFEAALTLSFLLDN